jgi:hypothetical protein
MRVAALNLYRGRSMGDIFEHAFGGVRLFRARPQSTPAQRVPTSTVGTADLLVDLSWMPAPQVTIREMLTAMLRAGRSHAEKRATVRRARRAKKRR